MQFNNSYKTQRREHCNSAVVGSEGHRHRVGLEKKQGMYLAAGGLKAGAVRQSGYRGGGGGGGRADYAEAVQG